MKLDVADLVLVGILSAAIHWLVARSYLFEFLWGRARGITEKLLNCAACSGFWIGVGLGFAGLRPLVAVDRWAQIVGAGLLALYLTPIFEGILVWGLTESTVPPMIIPPEAPPEALPPPLPDERQAGAVPQQDIDEEQ